MLKLLLVIVVLFAVALGFQLLGDASGELALTLGDTVYAVNLTTAIIGAVALFLLIAGLLWFLREILRAPWRMARGFRRRNHELGREAVSRGLVAIAAGDQRAAERAMLEATRRIPGQPLTLLLQAQAAQLKGDRVTARGVFQAMTEDPATRIAGLRGLYVEAEREGGSEIAHQIAAKAREEAPTAPWAARALMRHQTAAADWDAALQTLSSATDGRILDKRTARRQRAVILTAKARDKEDGEPEVARHAALEAHDLAADLVPAAVIAGRLLARQGDVRRATRVLEAAWKANPHPELADAYMHVRSGDSAGDRLKRAETLHRMRPQADEGRHAVARAAIDARDFARAREALKPLLEARPTQKTLILMGELEAAETGDRGRAREWMARAVYAPRDPAWTADGMVLEEWTPVSPVTGKLDAVEWKVPLTEIEGPRVDALRANIAAAEPSPGPPPAAMLESQSRRSEPVPSEATSEPVSPAPRSGNAGERLTGNVSLIEKAGAAANPTAPVAPPSRAATRESAPMIAPPEPPRPDDPGVGPPDEVV